MQEKPLNPQPPATPQNVDVRNSEATYTEDYARSLVNETYYSYSAKRRQNIDPRWYEADSLYFGQVTQRLWKGTKIPRAAYPQPIVFDQVETMVPILEQALFPDSEDWFQVLPNFKYPNPQTGEDLAPKIGRILTNNLKEMLDTSEDIGFPTGRREIINACKQSLLYKLGGCHLRWSARKKHPIVECVDIRDVFFDPKSHGPSPEMGSSMIWRRFMPVHELKKLRDTEDFEIPKDDVLYWLAQNAPGGEAPDIAKNLMYAMMRQNVQSSSNIYEPNIENREIEVLIYYNKSRVVWVLNRLHVAYNEPNPYSWYPFFFAPCYEVPFSSYGLSVPEIQEGSQRLAEGLFNLHLDELSLNVNPPRVETMQSEHDNGDLWGPGVRYKVRDAKTDLQFQTTGGMTSNVMDTIAFVQQNSYSRSGMNPIQQGGIPTPSNANRTASGMNIQMSGGNNRMYSMVKRFEDYLIVPCLLKMVEMLRMHLVMGEEIDGLDELGNYTRLNPAIWKLPLKIQVQSASRIITKDKILGLMPTLTQYFTQGQLLGALHQIGWTVNVPEILEALKDATGLGKRYSFARPLTQPEMQQMRQAATPKPDPNVQMKVEGAIQARTQAEDIKGKYAIAKEQIKQQGSAGPSPEEIQMEREKHAMEMEREQMKMAIEQLKLQVKEQESRIKLVTAQAMASAKQEEARMKLAMSAQQHQQNMVQAQESADMQLLNSIRSQAATGEPDEEEGDE